MAADSYITQQLELGTVHISEDVICGIVRDAVKDIEGVAGVSNTTGAELAEKVGIHSFSKGITTRLDEDHITVDLVISVSYGYNIVDVATKVQNQITSELQSMTGIDNITVNVHVAGIAF